MADTITSSSSAPVTDQTSRWPVYATKAALLTDLFNAPEKGAAHFEIIKRLSNTDTSTWADKGSRLGST